MCGATAQAQEPHTVRGRVTDVTGAAVPHATVAAIAPDSAFVTQTDSAANRDYTLGVPTLGSYTLSVSPTKELAASTRPLKITQAVTFLPVVLLRETVTQTIDVGGNDAVWRDASASRDSVDLSASALDQLPIFDQYFTSSPAPFLTRRLPLPRA